MSHTGPVWGVNHPHLRGRVSYSVGGGQLGGGDVRYGCTKLASKGWESGHFFYVITYTGGGIKEGGCWAIPYPDFCNKFKITFENYLKKTAQNSCDTI